jgi:hypothetical protein
VFLRKIRSGGGDIAEDKRQFAARRAALGGGKFFGTQATPYDPAARQQFDQRALHRAELPRA